VLPAEGATVAAMIGYNEAKRWSKHKHEFGNGSVEGIAGAEAANNAATGGAMVPTLALGIPGSGTTAVMLGAFLVLGIRPGPHLFTEQQDFVFAIFGSMLVANVMFFFLGLVGAKVFARLTLVPDTFLWPGVFVLSVIGAYSLDQSFEDVLIMIGSGLLGFVMRRYGFSVVPVAMGLILGELVETTLQQSLIIFDSNWLLFLSRPLVVVFLLLTVVGFCGPLIFDALQRRWKKG
jgi:putative tricarboxylic transport membrane protein